MAELKEGDEDAVFSPPPMGKGISPVAPRSFRSKKTRPIKLKESRRMTAGSEVLAPRRSRLKSGFSRQMEAQKERMEGEKGVQGGSKMLDEGVTEDARNSQLLHARHIIQHIDPTHPTTNATPSFRHSLRCRHRSNENGG